MTRSGAKRSTPRTPNEPRCRWTSAVEWVRRARGQRKRPPGGWESLTPTELQVVEHAAEGLSNAAIAGRMFISPATVKVHLGHVYAKVGVPNRAALATARAEHRACEPEHRAAVDAPMSRD